jgi:hypothetical protein
MPVITLTDQEVSTQLSNTTMNETLGGFSLSSLMSSFYDDFNFFQQPQQYDYFSPSPGGFLSDFSMPFTGGFSNGWFF